MRNRASTPPRDENEFINAGTAGIDHVNTRAVEKSDASKHSKAKPVSISFTAENLQGIDLHIRNEIVSGNVRVNRSDIVRAALLALDDLSPNEVSMLIGRVKLK